MGTVVTTFWRELLDEAENGRVLAAREYAKSHSTQAATLLGGYLIYTSHPGDAKDLFARAQRGEDLQIAQEACVYEARCYEYLGQPDEGLILIRSVLAKDLFPAVKAHALYVLSVFQGGGAQSLKTLCQIDLSVVTAGRKGRVFQRRARLQADMGKYDQALIEYAGAAAYFEEAGNRAGVAHAYNNKASVYRRLKRFADAHEAASAALSTLPKGDPFEANFLDQKAQVFLAEGKFDEAETIALRAVSLVEDTDRRATLCENLFTLARSYAGRRNYADASATFRRAEAIVNQLGSTELRFGLITSRRDAAKEFLRATEVELAEIALQMSDGSYRAAAKRLGLTHPGLIKLLARNSRQWKPKKPKSIIVKPLK